MAERIRGAGSERSEARITRETTISIALLTGLLSVSVVGTWRFASWSARLEARLAAIEDAIREGHDDPWDGQDMRRWVREMRLHNPDLRIPDVDVGG